MKRQSGRIDWITGLKGWCCFTVVMLHLIACFFEDALWAGRGELGFSGKSYHYISLTPINILFNGSFSVYIFWTISAFLIAYSWYSKYSLEDMERKILNKYFRVILPIAAIIVLSYVLIKLDFYYNVKADEIIGGSFFTNERDFSNVSIMTPLKDIIWLFVGVPTLIPPLWSMKAELIGACMTAFLLVLFGTNEKRYIIWSILVLMLLRGSSYYICFIMGIILADYDRNRVRDEKNSVLMNVVGIVSLLLGIVLGAYPPPGFHRLESMKLFIAT